VTRHNEAGAIIAHYLRQLTLASGRRWTEHNDHDMRRLAELLAEEDRETIAPFYQPAAPPELSVEPPAAEPPAAEPRQLDTRVTTVLDKPAGREHAPAGDLDDPNYQRWRQQRQQQDEQARRMLQRERSTR
jgi:hypothetical protein